MKAVVFERYGGPEVMAVRDIPDPEAGPDDVLVEVHAASVNPLDWKMREGVMRAMFEVPMPYVPGRDFSGVVHAVGANVTHIAPGDGVYGTADRMRQGTQAELLATPGNIVARKPPSLTHVEAASLAVTGVTMLSALEVVAPVAAGNKVLIHAGAGGVGCLAVQYAAHKGASVTSTASAANADYVQGLGAGMVIDYQTADFTGLPPQFDIVFDTMGGAVHRKSFEVLRPGGTLVYIHAAPIEGDPPRDDVEVKGTPVSYDTALLDCLTDLVEQGAIKPQVGTVFPLADAVTAYNQNQTGHAQGKIVLEVR